MYDSGEANQGANLTRLGLFLRMDWSQAQKELVSQLAGRYGGREAAVIADWVMERLTGQKKLDRLVRKTDWLSTVYPMRRARGDYILAPVVVSSIRGISKGRTVAQQVQRAGEWDSPGRRLNDGRRIKSR